MFSLTATADACLIRLARLDRCTGCVQEDVDGIKEEKGRKELKATSKTDEKMGRKTIYSIDLSRQGIFPVCFCPIPIIASKEI